MNQEKIGDNLLYIGRKFLQLMVKINSSMINSAFLSDLCFAFIMILCSGHDPVCLISV